jgi:hypothetical protein
MANKLRTKSITFEKRNEISENKKNKTDKERIFFSSYNPLSWGILFLTFWTTLRSVPNKNSTQNIVGYSFLGFSFVFWLLMVSPWMKKQMEKKWMTNSLIPKFLIPFVSAVTFFGFIFGVCVSIPQLELIDQVIAWILLLLWIFVYMSEIFRAIRKKV